MAAKSPQCTVIGGWGLCSDLFLFSILSPSLLAVPLQVEEPPLEPMCAGARVGEAEPAGAC